jgi:uncharacterized protein
MSGRPARSKRFFGPPPRETGKNGQILLALGSASWSDACAGAWPGPLTLGDAESRPVHEQSGNLVLSPTDLCNYLGCPHATVLDLRQLSGPPWPHTFSDTDQLLAQKGQEHETAHLRLLRDAGKVIAEIPSKGATFEDRVRLTDDALRGGVDVVYQAALAGRNWEGLADFLMKTDRPSALGPHSYEPTDAKLARRPEPGYLIQLGVYSELLGARQGLVPERVQLALGDGTQPRFRVRDFAAYVRRAQRRLERFTQAPPANSYPEPCPHCARCRWQERCAKQWEDDDDLSLVANIQRTQADKLKRAGIKTLAALAEMSPGTRVPDLNPDVCARLRAQAALQFRKRKTEENLVELIPADEGRGFARLPRPDPGDLFFDMEGDPFHPEGLEYLFGVFYHSSSEVTYRAFWAHDHPQEQQVFGQFMAFLHDHLAAYPAAYIYHYNHYEPTALKRLASRYAVAEHQLDDLLRGRTFVDLYTVVREAIRVSEPSYSLKNLETFYVPPRQGAVATAGDSIVVYNRWRVTQDPKLLDEIAAYNEVDCRSTAGLRDWLLKLRPEGTSWFTGTAVTEGAEPDPTKTEKRREREAQFADYQGRLQAAATGEDDYRQHLADLLGFYDREAKPQWWEFFDRQNRYDDELIDDGDCLAGLEQIGEPVPVKRSLVYTYRFPPQETKLGVGDQVVNVATGLYAGTIDSLNEGESLIQLKLGATKGRLPLRMSIGPGGPISTEPLRAAVYRFAASVLDGRNDHPAVRDILAKAPPRIVGRRAGEPIARTDDLLAAATEAVAGLDQSYLFIQGPPGSGKTYTSAHVIVELIRRGKRVGVTANSHKAINNLLAKIEELAKQRAVKFAGIKKSSGGDTDFDGTLIRNEYTNSDVGREVELIAGTAWLFAGERFDRHLDYLFIDEAGQVSMANVVATGTSARNIVLVGDQMQLGQPIQGVHPGEAGRSILDFLLGGQATVAPDRGIFLNRTRRLRPEICRFISDAFYEGRLEPEPFTASRRLIFDAGINDLVPQGVHFHSVAHSGCSQKSRQEGDVVKDYFERLLRERFSDGHDGPRPLTPADILVVSPYNMQVNYLRSVLPAGARVGTVDKFQGQEAPVAIVSMATSGGDYLPRDIDFLFSANRLNVAISRAQCLAILVASPELLATECRTVEQLRLVNHFCQLAEHAVAT